VQGLPPLQRVLLELGPRLLGDLLRGPRELGPQARDHGALLLDRALHALGILADLRLRLRHQLPLPGLDALELVRQTLLELLDVA
jgi:hypothetical protein